MDTAHRSHSDFPHVSCACVCVCLVLYSLSHVNLCIHHQGQNTGTFHHKYSSCCPFIATHLPAVHSNLFCQVRAYCHHQGIDRDTAHQSEILLCLHACAFPPFDVGTLHCSCFSKDLSSLFPSTARDSSAESWGSRCPLLVAPVPLLPLCPQWLFVSAWELPGPGDREEAKQEKLF